MNPIVFDIDGTLSLPGERVSCLSQTPPDWDSFYERCDEDLPNWPAIEVYRALLARGGNELILLTGRRESTRQKTEAWLRRYGVFAYDRLLMRADGDRRHDTVVKPELLHLRDIRPFLVFEDRSSMVEHWRNMGIPCFQVAKGDF